MSILDEDRWRTWVIETGEKSLATLMVRTRGLRCGGTGRMGMRKVKKKKKRLSEKEK